MISTDRARRCTLPTSLLQHGVRVMIVSPSMRSTRLSQAREQVRILTTCRDWQDAMMSQVGSRTSVRCQKLGSCLQ